MIHNPCPNLLALSQPSNTFKALNESLVVDGTAGRFLFIKPEAKFAPITREEEDRQANLIRIDDSVLPNELKEMLRETCKDKSVYAMATDVKPAIPMPISNPHVREISRQYQNELTARRADTNRTEGDGALYLQISARDSEKAKKLAMVYAFSNNPDLPIINEDAIRWGWEFALHSTRLLEANIRVNRTHTLYERDCAEIVDHILRQGAIGVTDGELVARFKKLRPKERAEAIQDLQNRGEIVATKGARHGRPATIYLHREYIDAPLAQESDE
jgi:hypothetical protein